MQQAVRESHLACLQPAKGSRFQSQVYPKCSPSSTVMVSLGYHLARSGIIMAAHLCAFLEGFATLV